MKFIYTPGPTQVANNVMLARAQSFTNPDLDISFFDKYREICSKLQKIFKTNNEVLILNGEGMLGLEAACCCLTEKNDNVLVISNGIFGKGFKDIVELFDGNVTLFESAPDVPFSMHIFKKFLESNNNFKYATIVHCDTPSSMLNPIHDICKALKDYNILTIVDMVSSLGGSYVNVDESNIDIAICASQKCFSAPPGLTFISISKNAINSMKSRKSKIQSYYMNLLNFSDYYEKKWFPYTMPISDIIAFEVAIDNILNEGLDNVLQRHKKISISLHKALKNNNIDVYLDMFTSSETVTCIKLKKDIKSKDVISYIDNNFNILLSSSIGFLSENIIRIGHMGENARYERIIPVLSALDKAISIFYNKTDINLVHDFNFYFNEV